MRGILSVDISNSTGTAGNFNGKKALEAATREEIKNEVWAQLKLGGERTRPRCSSMTATWSTGFLTPISSCRTPGTVTNAEPLLINHVGSLALRPEAHTEIGNLFLAADDVRTYTDLATMEAANEAARRATNAILAVSGIAAPPCGLWEFDIPSRCATRSCSTGFGSEWACRTCTWPSRHPERRTWQESRRGTPAGHLDVRAGRMVSPTQ